MNISVTDELEDYLKFKGGVRRIRIHIEVIAEALRLLRDRDLLRGIQSEKLNRDLEAAVAHVNRGEVQPLEDVIKRLEQMSA